MGLAFCRHLQFIAEREQNMRFALFKILVAACVVFEFGVSPVGAVNTIVEHFDYTDASSVGGQGGAVDGWADVWSAVAGSGTLTVTASGLSYPNLPETPSGNKMSYDVAFSSTNSLRFFTTGFSSGTFYLSYIIENLVYDHPDPGIGDVVGGRFAGVALYAGGTEKMLLGQGSQFDGTAASPTKIGVNRVLDNGSGLVGTAPGSATNFLPGGPSNVQSLLVLRVDLDAGNGTVAGNERVWLWVNPDLSLPESSNTPIGNGPFSTDIDFTTINRVRIGGGGLNATATYAKHIIDELRISDVSPFAPPVPGDYNNNGTVDGADYVQWRKGGPLANEVDTPGTVNQQDYVEWRMRFGNPGAGSGLGTAPIPEPGACVLAALVLCGLLALRGRR
jgi:hypothetical protein